MKRFLNRTLQNDRGVLTFEWILLITVLLIGIVGGLSAVRDGLITELGDVTGAVMHIDQSYTVTTDPCTGLGNAFEFEDTLDECEPARSTLDNGQGPPTQCPALIKP